MFMFLLRKKEIQKKEIPPEPKVSLNMAAQSKLLTIKIITTLCILRRLGLLRPTMRWRISLSVLHMLFLSLLLVLPVEEFFHIFYDLQK